MSSGNERLNMNGSRSTSKKWLLGGLPVLISNASCESSLRRNIMHHLYLPAMAADILKTSVFVMLGRIL
ncbi:MAG: hypothetical protein ACXV96_07545, partial [Candidatus Angelobacter sp.]